VSDRALFSRKEAAAYVGVSLSTLDVITARGLVRVRRIGRRVLIHHAELDRFVRADHPRIWPEKQKNQTIRPRQDKFGKHSTVESTFLNG